MRQSNFPLVIQLVETGENLIVNTPEEIPSGVAFKVLVTRADEYFALVT